jgi:hypothetical protein
MMLKEICDKSGVDKVLLTLGVMMLLNIPAVSFAQVRQFGDEFEAPAGTQGGSDIVTATITIMNGLLVLAALAALIVIIIGGVRYIFSQGDEENAVKARQSIVYAVVGLIVIGLAAVLVNFIFNVIKGTT